jgi:hypothetical protein
MLLPRSAAVRAANCAVNEAQRKAKEDRKKRYKKQVRRDRGKDVSDEEEEGEEEGEITDDVVDIPWDDLVEENEPRDGGSSSQQQAKGDADLTLGNLPLGDPSRSTWDRPSPLSDGSNLLLVGFDAALGDDEPEQHTSWDPYKCTFWG